MKNVDHAARKGRKTENFCVVCKLFICKYCWSSFHKDAHVELPACCEKLQRLRPRPAADGEDSGSDGSEESEESYASAARNKKRRIERRVSV